LICIVPLLKAHSNHQLQKHEADRFSLICIVPFLKADSNHQLQKHEALRVSDEQGSQTSMVK